METRANHVWVGAVTLLILGALALFIVWLARLGGGAQDGIAGQVSVQVVHAFKIVEVDCNNRKGAVFGAAGL